MRGCPCRVDIRLSCGVTGYFGCSPRWGGCVSDNHRGAPPLCAVTYPWVQPGPLFLQVLEIALKEIIQEGADHGNRAGRAIDSNPTSRAPLKTASAVPNDDHQQRETVDDCILNANSSIHCRGCREPDRIHSVNQTARAPNTMLAIAKIPIASGSQP
jgi:hypothetical protein